MVTLERPLEITVKKKKLVNFLRERGLYTDKVKKAIEFAEKAHANTLRDGHLGYMKHHLFPITYNAVMITEKPTEELVCKALLHDTIEDTHVTKEDIEREFGKEIAEGVHRLTVYEGENVLRKIPHLKEDEKTIRILDRISNITSMLGWDEKRRKSYRNQTKKMIKLLEDHPHVKFLKRYYKVVWEGELLPPEERKTR